VLPGPPLPDDVSFGRHLDEVITVHLAVVILGAGSTATDYRDDRSGKRHRAKEKHVPIAQPDAVVVMIGTLELPQDPPLPVHFQYGASLEGQSSHVCEIWDLSVIEERPAVGEIAIRAWRVRHVPGVDNASL
jgi:hypothetical protein